jgi:peptide/nickel transport system substrate-binding protein
VALAAETDSYSPYASAWSSSAYEVASAIYDPLAAVDDKGVSHPYLAQDFMPNEDFTQWTIKLRAGISFHNGEPLDAAAVKKNIDAARKGVLTSQALTALQDVVVLDPSSVLVKMSRPWSTFPAALSVQVGFMAAPAMLDDPAGTAARPIGTGPFVFQDRQRDAYVTTKRNPNYWRKADDGTQLPYLDAAVFKVLPDASSRRQALAAGDVDAIMDLTPDGLTAAIKASENGETQLITDADQETDETIIGFNTTKLPFSDPVARQALAYGIDQQQLSTTVYGGVFPGAWGMFEQSSPYYIAKKEAGYPEHDASKARQLAEQYQAAHGMPLEFSTLIPPDPQYLAIAQAFQAQAADFGVKVNVQAVEQTQLLSKVIVAGDYEATWFTLWSSPSPDRSYLFLALPPAATGLSLNFSRFDDPTIRDALDRFRSTTNQQTRFETIKVEQQSLAKNLQVLFIVHSHAGFEYSNRAHGLRSTFFPGTDRQAYSPYVTTPFLTTAWKSNT